MAFDRFWQRLGKLALGLMAFNIASHVMLPGVSFSVFVRNGQFAPGGPLLWLYDRLGGGGLSRLSVVALGFMPYFTVRIGLLLARRAFPGVAHLGESTRGQRTLRWWTRGLTVGVSMIQSVGLAQSLLNVPGLVLEPGPGFMVRMVAVLTGGALVAMMLSESVEDIVHETLDTSRSDEPQDALTIGPTLAASPALTAGPAQPLDATMREREKSNSPL